MDTRVRRGLLIFRNHCEGIQVSTEFSERLRLRLDDERARPPSPVAPSVRLSVFSIAALAVVVIGLAAGAGLTAPTVGSESADQRIASAQHPVLVTSQPTVSPAFVASVSMGMAILPALMLTEELHDADGTRTEWLQAAAWNPYAETK